MSDFNLWDFNFDGWTLGEDALYMQALAEAQRTGNVRLLFAHWSRMVRHWPFPLNPSDLKSYVNLEESVYNEIIERINRGIRLPKTIDGRSGGGET